MKSRHKNSNRIRQCRPARRGADRHARRGSLYIAVLTVGSIISILGMSALLIGRISHRAHTGISDSTTARLNAQAALRLGMLEIEENPDWRFSFDTAEWIAEQPLSDGTYSLTVTDPSDDDISDAAADPVVLTGIGRKGAAVHRTQITLAPLYRGFACLQSAVHAGDDVDIDDSYRFYSDHVVSANDNVRAANSFVDAPVEAADLVYGSSFMGTYLSGAPVRDVPSAGDVLSFYRANGTWIDVNDIPGQFADMVRNGGAEDGTTFWSELTSTVASDGMTASDGANSFLVSSRSDALSGLTQDITHLVQSGRTYVAELAIYPTAVGQQFYVHIELSDNSGDDDHVAGPFTGTANTWTSIRAEITPWFEEPLSSAKLVINTSAYSGEYSGASGYDVGDSESQADFRVDDIQLRESGSTRAMDQILLSPENNPFGAANAKGIYLIDLQGQKLIIRKSRIHGTLVLIDPADSTELGNGAPLAMSPAVPQYPSLLVDGGRFYMNPSAGSLVESALQVNLNPSDAPYDNVGSDDDMDDTFASKIEGLVFSYEDIRLRNVTIHGAVISENDVDIEDDFAIKYDNRFYRNPPPGFSGPEQIRLLLGSARRVTE